MRDATAADGEPDSNETSMYQDMFDKQVALTLSKHQDLGIARLFERQLGGKPRRPGSPAPAPLPPSRPAPAMRRADCRRPSRKPPTASSITAEHAAQFVSQVLPTIRRAAARAGGQSAGAAGTGRLGDRLGPAHAAHRRRQSESQYVRHQGGRGMERRAGRRGHRGIRAAASRRSGAPPFGPTDRSRKASATSPICWRARRGIAM